jgi:hypothetical protein
MLLPLLLGYFKVYLALNVGKCRMPGLKLFSGPPPQSQSFKKHYFCPQFYFKKKKTKMSSKTRFLNGKWGIENGELGIGNWELGLGKNTILKWKFKLQLGNWELGIWKLKTRTWKDYVDVDSVKV